jgi:hypothetical protein
MTRANFLSGISGGATDKITEGDTTVEVIDTGTDGVAVFTINGTERMRLCTTGVITTGGETSPDPDIDPNGLFLYQVAQTLSMIGFKNSAVNHGFTTYAEATTYGTLGIVNANGGLKIRGFAETSGAVGIGLYAFATTPTTAESNSVSGVISFTGYTSAGALGDDDNLITFANTGSSGTKIIVKGNGDIWDLSGFISAQGIVQPTVAKSASYETTVHDHTILVTAGSTDRTITLTSDANTGQIYVIKKVDSGTGQVIIDADIGNIDGASTAIINAQYASRVLQFDGSNWQTLSADNDALYWYGTTANAVATEIFLKGEGGIRYSIDEETTTYLNLTVVARANATNKTKVWDAKAVISRDDSDNSAVVGTPSYTVVAQSDGSGGTQNWDIVITVNDGDDTARVTVTGQASTDITWLVTT